MKFIDFVKNHPSEMGGMMASMQQSKVVFDAQNSTDRGWFLSTQNSMYNDSLVSPTTIHRIVEFCCLKKNRGLENE